MPAVTVSDITVLPRISVAAGSQPRRVKSITTAPQGFEGGDTQFFLDVRDPKCHVFGFFHVQARGRLIKQQQRRFRTQRTSELNHFSDAIWQARNHGVSVVLQVKKLDDRFHMAPRGDFGITDGFGEKHLLPEATLLVAVTTDQ